METAIAIAAAVGLVLGTCAAVVVAVRMRRATGLARARLLWLAWGALVTITTALIGMALNLLVDWPSFVGAGLAIGCLVVPLAVVLGRSPTVAQASDGVLVHSIVIAGVVGLVGGIYVIVVLGLGRAPEGQERTVLVLSMAAAAVACVLAFPARRRLEEWANQKVYGDRHSPDEALQTFGGRMSRAVPLDELLLQLVETLKKTMSLAAAEIWTGADGVLTRTVSVPDRPPAALDLGPEELVVAARAHAQGNAWLAVWAPALLEGRSDHLLRSVSIAHLGELLGMIVIERAGDEAPFSEEEDRVLVDLARQVGLALHNVRLDSALQASLEELQRRNKELVASRSRIVAAADESRRRIERNLHDGAQQHLVALAVKVGLVKQLLDSDPTTARAILDEFRGDVQAALEELRELAHGIYPPLLRDRGLAEAITSAVNRAPMTTRSELGDVGRYDTEIETAIYFCCLEALQNAGKHAGEDAIVSIALGNGDGSLWFEVSDDGAGFDPATAAESHGFVNMRDRLGAVGGELAVTAAPGSGTSIRGTVPVAVCDAPDS